MKLIHLLELGQYKEIKEKENFLIFKHSPTCPISGWACKQVHQVIWSDTSETPLYQVNVIDQRDISQYIAKDLDITHESPQIIWVKNKKVIHHASHFDITTEFLNKLITEVHA